MRSRTLIVLATLGLATAAPANGQRPVPVPAGLLDDVKYLSSDALGGRMTGSAGADSAAEYVARRFADAGLQPGPGGWFQEFTVSADAPGARRAGLAGARGRNVIGVLPGSDPSLRTEAVIVGAHYDHLGGGGFGALDPDSSGAVHNGADDNASGTSALIHNARTLAADPPARTTVFIAFSGEEVGLLGSAHYVRQPLYPLDRTIAMVNLDMVGRMKNKRLIVYGTATATEFPALLDSLNWYQGFDLKKQGDGYGPSDQSSFFAARRPVLHVFTDLHEDYHRTTDDWQKVNVADLARVIDFTAGVATALANRPGPLTFVDAAPEPTHATAAPGAVTPGYGAYLGTVPDMSESPGGVLLSGVRAGSPGEKAGLRAGDVITRIGKLAVTDLQAMTDALRAHRPGDVVEITVTREGKPVTIQATLGKRS